MRGIVAVVAVTLTVVLAACGSGNSGSESAASSTGGGSQSLTGKKVAYLAPSLDISYWQWVYAGVKQQAGAMGMKAVSYNANNSPGDQLSNVNTAINAGADILSIGPVSSTSTPPVLAAAERAKVPISFAGTAHMLEWFLRHFAGYVDKLLKGAQPRDLPIQQLFKYDLTINLMIARDLGVEVPNALLLRADELIK